MNRALIPVALLLLSALAGGYYAVYQTGYANAIAESNALAVVASEETAEKTRVKQVEYDNLADAFYNQTIDLVEQKNDLQTELKTLQLQSPVGARSCNCVYMPSDNFRSRMRLITEAGDCSGMPKANDKPLIIKDTNGLERYIVGISNKYCKVAVQLVALIKAYE